jgi:hypothetical protein
MAIWSILPAAFWYILLQFGILYGHLVYFMVIWTILRPFGILYGNLVDFTAIWYILLQFGILYGHFGIYSPSWYVAARKEEPAVGETAPSVEIRSLLNIKNVHKDARADLSWVV